MDLSEFQVVSDSPVFFQLTNPRTGKLMEDENGPVGVEIWGRDSEAFQAVNRRAINDSIENALNEEDGKSKLDAALGAKVARPRARAFTHWLAGRNAERLARHGRRRRTADQNRRGRQHRQRRRQPQRNLHESGWAPNASDR